jgi:DNA-binding NarL/FixJ family response regulator
MIRLVVADDHPIVRAGLHRIVADCPDMEVVGETDDGNTLLDVLEATDADIVLLDIAMPGLPFLDLLKLLRERWPRLRTLIVSTYSEDQYAVRALRAGAAGYLTKQRSPDELAAAVRRV